MELGVVSAPGNLGDLGSNPSCGDSSVESWAGGGRAGVGPSLGSGGFTGWGFSAAPERGTGAVLREVTSHPPSGRLSLSLTHTHSHIHTQLPSYFFPGQSGPGEGLSAQLGRKTGLGGEDRADHSPASPRGSRLLDPEASTWRPEVGSHSSWPGCYCVALHLWEHLSRLVYDEASSEGPQRAPHNLCVRGNCS